MRIIVTGGTGFIGKSLVVALVARGDEVVVLARNAEGARATLDRKATVSAWPTTAAEWLAVVEEADAIVHLAGENVAAHRWTDARKEALRKSRIESTEAIARAIGEASNRPKVWVSASAVGFYGARHDDHLLTENSPGGTDFLAKLCVEWEQAAEGVRELGVRTVHPRTGLVLGMHEGVLAVLLRPFRWFVGGPIGSGHQWMSWIHIHDAVRALLFALDTDSLVGPFNVVGPNPVTMNEFAFDLASALGRPSAMRVPAFALKALLGNEMAEMLLGGQRALPQRLEREGFSFTVPTLQLALRDLIG